MIDPTIPVPRDGKAPAGYTDPRRGPELPSTHRRDERQSNQAGPWLYAYTISFSKKAALIFFKKKRKKDK
jgi:hypothetical protein